MQFSSTSANTVVVSPDRFWMEFSFRIIPESPPLHQPSTRSWKHSCQAQKSYSQSPPSLLLWLLRLSESCSSAVPSLLSSALLHHSAQSPSSVVHSICCARKRKKLLIKSSPKLLQTESSALPSCWNLLTTSTAKCNFKKLQLDLMLETWRQKKLLWIIFVMIFLLKGSYN